MVKETRSIRRQTLPNDLTVITEQMPHIRSVAIGIWLKSGSRDEDSEFNGISHFIEHMVFKGTETRSAEAIARQVDSIGGNMDAFTAKECICSTSRCSMSIFRLRSTSSPIWCCILCSMSAISLR